MNINKRIRNRVEFAVHVSLEVDGKTTSYPASQDISMGGVYVLTDSPLPVGTEGGCSIVLEFGDQRRSICAEFDVVRVVESETEIDKPGMGIQFTDLDTDPSLTLFNVIKYQTLDE